MNLSLLSMLIGRRAAGEEPSDDAKALAVDGLDAGDPRWTHWQSGSPRARPSGPQRPAGHAELERQPELRKLMWVPAVADSGCQAGSWTGSFLRSTRACVPSAWITISLSGGEPQSP
jgi:hypothetical protein